MKRSVCLAAVLVAAVSTAVADAHVAGPPTVAECARLQAQAPPFRGSRLAATVFCLRPRSIRATASATWTTCPTTPIEEPCAEGSVSVAFRSRPGFTGDPDSWGGENYPGAGLFSLPGTGTYRCKAEDVDRQIGRTVMRSYGKTLALRDAAVGFAAAGKSIKVTTSIHPGLTGPFGQNANVRLGQPDTCQLSGLPVGAEAVRAVWPGKSFSPASLAGASATVVSSGSFSRAFPVPASEGLSPGVLIQTKIRWSFTVVVVPALKRR